MTENDLFEWLMQDDRILRADNIPHFMRGSVNYQFWEQTLESLNYNLVCCKIHSDLVDDYAWIGQIYPRSMLEEDASDFETVKQQIFDTLEFKEKEHLDEHT